MQNLLHQGSCSSDFFCITKPRRELDADLTHVNKVETASLSYFLAIDNYFQSPRPLRDVIVSCVAYKRYVDDSLTIMPDKTSAVNSLEILNQCHSFLKFTIEMESNDMLPISGTQLLNKHTQVETKVYIKPTNTGLLLHYKSHVDNQYKRRFKTTEAVD